MNITLILHAIIAAFQFPTELSKFIKLISKAPEEKKAEINAQVDAWILDSSTSVGDGEEVEPPKWEK